MNNLQVSKLELDQFKLMLDDWIPTDASYAIASENRYIYFAPSTHHGHLKIGEAIHPSSIAAKVLNTRKKTQAIMDESLFGTPYYGIGYPIYIHNQEAALIVVLPSSYSPKNHVPYKFLTGRQDEDWTPISIEQISHIESLQKRTWFYAHEEQYRTTITLKELQTRLPDYFVRIHRSYILNIYFIKKITRDLASNYLVELKSGQELPVSQSYINDLKRVLDF